MAAKVPDVKCLLCGGRCWFEEGGENRQLDLFLARLGWLLLPLLAVIVLGGWLDWPAGMAFVVGVGAWAVFLYRAVYPRTRWVCTACGACYPACTPPPDAPVADDEGDDQPT